MSTLFLFTNSYTIIQGNMYHIDGSQIEDSFNVTATHTLARQFSAAPESPLGILIFCCCLKTSTDIILLWLESTTGDPFDDASSTSSSSRKSHIWKWYRHDTHKQFHQIRHYVPSIPSREWRNVTHWHRVSIASHGKWSFADAQCAQIIIQ